MADVEYVAGVDIQVDDKDLKSTAKSADKTTKSVKKAGDAAKKTKVDYAKLGAQLLIIKALVVDSSIAWAALEASQGQADRALREANATMAQTNRILDTQADLFDKYGVAINESNGFIAQLVDASGDAEKANTDLALAQDIAAQSNLDLATTVQILTNVRNGNIEGLEQIKGLHKKQLDDIAKIEDASLREARALTAITKAAAGAAAELSGLQDQQQSFIANSERAWESLGRGITIFFEFAAAVAPTGLLADKNTTAFTRFNNVIDRFLDRADVTVQKYLDIQSALFSLTLFQDGYTESLLKAQRARDKQQILDIIALEEQKDAQVRAAEEEEARANQRAVLTAAWVKDNKDAYDELAELDRLRAESDQVEEELQEKRRDAAAERHKDEVAEFNELQELVQGVAEKTDEDFAKEEEKLRLAKEELEIQESLAFFRLNGFEDDAARLEIQLQKLGPLQEELALKELQAGIDAKAAADAEKVAQKKAKAEAKAAKDAEKAAKTRINLLNNHLSLSRSLTGAAAALANEDEAASRVQAAIDGGVYAYKALASAGAGNFFGAAQFAAASVAAFALAGRAAPAEDEAAGAAAASDPGSQATTQAASEGGTQARSTFGNGASGDTTLIVNYASVVAGGPEQAREVSELIANDLETRI